MTSLSANEPRPITVDEAITCVYCGNYSAPLKSDRRGQVVCVNFEDCVYNRLESGTLTDARAPTTRPPAGLGGLLNEKHTA